MLEMLVKVTCVGKGTPENSALEMLQISAAESQRCEQMKWHKCRQQKVTDVSDQTPKMLGTECQKKAARRLTSGTSEAPVWDMPGGLATELVSQGRKAKQ